MDIKYEPQFGLYGLMAEFDTPEALVAAAVRAHEAGYRKMDAYTPFPVEGLASALGSAKTRISSLIGIGGLLGCIGGFGLVWWISVVAYPVNVAGRPLNSWPAYIPITFECTVLLASLTAVIGMLAWNGFPQPYHPVFNVPRFQRASVDRFFLCIEAHDPKFALDETRAFLTSLGPAEVSDVAR